MDWWISNPGGISTHFDTQAQAEAFLWSYNNPAGVWDELTRKTESDITETLTEYLYSAPPVSAVIIPPSAPHDANGWTYNGQGYLLWPSEAQAIENLLSSWPNTDGCGPAVLTVTGPWVSTNSFIGISVNEERPYRLDEPAWQWGVGCVTVTYTSKLKRSRNSGCPTNYSPDVVANNCIYNYTATIRGKPLQCAAKISNPCDIGNGDKAQTEIDYEHPQLRFRREYHSAADTDRSFLGHQWTHNFGERLIMRPIGGGAFEPKGIATGAGYSLPLISVSSGLWASREGKHRVTYQAPYYVLDAPGAAKRYYRKVGEPIAYALTYYARLEKIVDGGKETTLAYSASTGKLQTVADSRGRTLTFSYDPTTGLLGSLTTPDGNIAYAYDSSGNLATVTYPGGHTRQYHYENASFPSALTGITDERGIRYANYSYDAKGRAIVSEHAGGAERNTFTYNSDNTVSATNPLGKVDSWSFSTIASSIRPTAHDQDTFVYASGTGYLTSKTVDGVTTQYGSYDSKGQYAYMIEAVGTPVQRRTDFLYDPRFSNKVTQESRLQSDGSGRVRISTFDDQGSTLTETVRAYAAGGSFTERTKTFEYNGPDHQLSKIDGPRTDVSDVMTFTYYTCTTGAECGQLHTTTDALGHITTFSAYDASGKPLAMTDPNGIAYSFTYHPRGWLQSSTRAGNTTTYAYNGIGKVSRITVPDGSYVEYGYDDAQRLTSVTDNLGNRVVYTLDAAGNRTAESVYDPGNTLRRTQSRVFDTLSRLKEIHGVDGQLTELEYDANGNLIMEIFSYPTEHQYDALNRRTKTIDANYGETTYGLNNLDQIATITDAMGLTTSYSPNAFGEAVTQVSPDTGTTSFSYDSAGNLLSKTDARGITATRQYDALNRVTSIDLPGTASDISYQYDGSNYSLSEPNGVGRLTGVVTDTETVALYYDARGNLTKRSSASSVTQYQYDLADRVISMTYPSGARVTYTRNANGRVTEVSIAKSGATTVLASSIVSQPDGRPQAWTLGNGLSATRTFDLDGRVTAHIDPVVIRSYDYDDRDFIAKSTDSVDPSRTRWYGYNDRGWLWSSNPTTSQYWIHNAVGNFSTYYRSGAIFSTYTYVPGSNRLQSIIGGTPKSFTYDAAGNTTSDGTLTFGYDAAGRLKTVTGSPVAITDQRYNEQGQRVSKTAGGVTTQYVYDQAGQLIAKSVGGVEREIVWLDNMPLAALEGGQIYFFHTDHLNTPQKLTNMSGAVVWDAFYEPFGKANIVTSTISNDLRFPGQVADSETGLNQNWNRDYDPSLGRYLQSDPIGLEGGINTYTYAGGNPIMSIDPDGTSTIAIGGEMGGAIGGPAGAVIGAVIGAGIGYWIFNKNWTCTASCNVQQIDPCADCPARTTGVATGRSEEAACREAKRAATQSTPRGCYSRHCQCTCSKG